MRERLLDLLGQEMTEKITIKTFHSFGAFILKNEAEALGYQKNFSIYSEDDKIHLLKKIARELSGKQVRQLADRISQAKNNLMELKAEDQLIDSGKDDHFFHYYKIYQQALGQRQAFDFDDLILQPIKLFQQHSEIKQKYQQQFPFIFVDEYQDINFAQYMLLQQLTSHQTHLCVIGDPDQAIYGFRGSDRRFFLQFEKDFPGAKTIRLEKNYRSDSAILKASTQIIEKSKGHQPAKIWSNLISNTRIDIFQTPTDKSEAETIVHQIEKMVGATSFFSVDSGRAGEDGEDYCSGFSDIAVLYRTNAQLAPIEEAFLRSGIPYQTFGEIPFFEQPEVKELLSFFKVIHNPHSDIDLLKIVNIPPRNIGDQTLKILMEYQRINEISLWQAMERCQQIALLSETQKQPILQFVRLVHQLQNRVEELNVVELLEAILKDFGLTAYFKNDRKRQYYWEKLAENFSSFNGGLVEFLEKISLQKETDYYDPGAEKVSLMTLHAAKGLEFAVVFIAGCEEDLIPFRRKNDPTADIEEERRLLYVGMTRAKKRLILLHAKSRFIFGERRSAKPSRFLNDIEQALKAFKQAEIKEKPKKKSLPDSGQIELF